MRKIFLPVFLLLSVALHAQLNNSWIDYSKTYYKFRLAKDTLCHIPQSVLSSAGLGGVNADYFQLWRNGEQVRIYTSVTGSPLGAADYIEFWGEMNDGKPDNQLYREPDFQLADKWSLETDTVAYFLTVNNVGPANLRYTNAVNNPPGAMVPDPYFMRKIDYYYKTQINRGLAYVVGEYVYSASYDDGEGWTSADVAPGYDLTQEIFNLNVYTAAPANSLSVRIAIFGNAPNTRDIHVKLFQNEIPQFNINMPYFSHIKKEVNNLPLALLQNPNYVPIYINGSNSSPSAIDRIVAANIGITYPATFNFNNQKNFYFELKPSATGNYLYIDNFNYGSTAPILYDMNTGARYTGDIVSTPGKVKLVLPASSDPVRRFMLISRENPYTINSMTQRTFVDYGNTANQGDYIIISHPALYNDGSGVNQVDKYREYRTTAAGGGFDAKIFNIDELTDQFGFGIKKHPSSIRDFIRYADQQFTAKPKYVFLIGRGVNYQDYKAYETNPVADRLNLIPTFGWPASDVLLSSTPGTTIPIVPIGRLGVVNGTEVKDYLEKMIEYEQVQHSSSPTIDDKGWMKNMIHVVGGKDSAENALFLYYMSDVVAHRSYKVIAEDTLYGGNVETFTKTATGAVQQANSQRIEELFDKGLGFIGYFGHSSANTFEFNLSNPDIYTNQGKYPFFNVSGCSAGNYYIYDPQRLSGSLTLSEKYVLAPNRGSIGFLADTHFGIPPFLNLYNNAFYTAFANTLYGNTVGNQIKVTLQNNGGGNPNLDYYTRVHLEEIGLQGDPALRINAFEKPDYVIEEPLIRISPNIISVADDNFKVSVKMMNIGKATGDSIWVSIKRRLPNDSVKVLVDSLIRGTKYMDSINLEVHINPTTDKGLNQLIVTLDYTNRVDELFETNNTVTKDFYIFEDELRPAYPYDLSIINQQNITYSASTANPLSGVRQYVMEIDTTELFNSAFKKSYNASGPGGIVQFTPGNISFTDSTVYYWRVAMVPSGTAAYIWNSFSFIYLPNGGTGFNQSHYFQHQKSKYTNISLDPDKKFRFNQIPRSLTIRTGIYPYINYDRINVNLDFDQLELYGCVYNSLQFYIFDTTTLLPWRNRNVSATNALYGSARVCQNSATTDTTRAFFEFPYTNAASRKAAMDFIDNNIPNGMYVAITNLGNELSNTTFVNDWKQDQTTLGTGNSLYHKLRSIGFTEIDSFYHNLPFLYFFKKNDPSYTPRQVMGPGDTTGIEESFQLNSTNTAGQIESAIYGPARKWTAMHWRGYTIDPLPVKDSVSIQVWGIKNDGSTNLLATVAPSVDTSLSFVDAVTYPYIKLKMNNTDPVYATPYQLRYLRVNADYVPEGAVAPNVFFKMKDSVEQGENIEFALAFKNISQTKFDSLIKVKFTITDRNNVTHVIDIPKRKALIAGDTLTISYTIDTRNYSGTNTLFVDFNPDHDQPEQYHYNNVLYKDFFVKADKYNPLLDVTFDGVHILNRDIISARPNILIKLKDESRFLELKDTALLKVQVRFPSPDGTPGELRNYYFGGDTMRFNPANLAGTGDNTASIDFKPAFPYDGEYELIVSGKDVMGNTAGNLAYHVMFTVINKPMISNMFNYPNPFTTSTAFVFTVTGSEVPQNIRIQVLTITGKIVREITKEELGPLHVGNNVTAFKWDGTDTYGQRLANGVYIYRVLTNLNGKSPDKYETYYNKGSDRHNTSDLFNKGYGKMYLMR